jgi:hypothetical protein
MGDFVKVYVACSSHEVERASEMMQLIDDEDQLHNVVDWTKDVDDWDVLDEDELSDRNIKAQYHIMTSDVVVAIVDRSTSPSRGVDMIIGMAIGFGIPLVIVDLDGQGHFFTDHCQRVVTVRTFEQAIPILKYLKDSTAQIAYPSNTTLRDMMIELNSLVDQERSSVGDLAIDLIHDLENLKQEIPGLVHRASSLQRRSINKMMDRIQSNLVKMRKQYNL